jgi:acyl carrier protein
MSATQAASAADIAAWLRRELATRAAIPAAEISADTPLDRLGLDSQEAAEVAVDLEFRVGGRVPATLLRDQPTIEAAAAAVAHGAPRAPAARPGSLPEQARAEPATGPRDPAAILGIGCRLPSEGANDLAELLGDRAGPDAGVTDEAFDFDAFELAPDAAASTEAPVRELLEATWEALEDAGIPFGRAWSCTGVFVEVSGFGTGSGDPAGTRLASTLRLRGPSLTVETGERVSLDAVRLAFRSLRDGECDLALAGGASAGHGTAVVVLARLTDAVGARDPIYATIEEAAVHRGGRDGASPPTTVLDDDDLACMQAAAGAAVVARAALAIDRARPEPPPSGPEEAPSARLVVAGPEDGGAEAVVRAAPRGAREW